MRTIYSIHLLIHENNYPFIFGQYHYPSQDQYGYLELGCDHHQSLHVKEAWDPFFNISFSSWWSLWLVMLCRKVVCYEWKKEQYFGLGNIEIIAVDLIWKQKSLWSEWDKWKGEWIIASLIGGGVCSRWSIISEQRCCHW